MFKKILLLLCLFINSTVFANFNDILVVNVQHDWISKQELEKEAIVQEVRELLFTNPIEEMLELKIQFPDKYRDKNYKEHYIAASAGYKELGDYNIAAFYYKNMKNIYMYALQDKKDISKNFYYDALGKLRFVDIISGLYPDFPYSAIQYNAKGKPISVIYYVSKDCQYLFKPDGTFEGVWYKYKLYNQKSRVILTRTSY